MYQISLFAAFIAGMVALFAPCCVSYLLPAYLGSIFKEKSQIVGMTLVYGLGIFLVMLPIVLGVRVLSSLFFRWHDGIYTVGGLFLLLVAGMTLIGVKLPMISIRGANVGNKRDIASIFTMGVFSGITSACCAPVLVGIMTLSALSWSFWEAAAIGFTYVLGMVFPLFFAAVLVDKSNFLQRPLLKKQVSQLTIMGQTYPVLVANIIGALVFFITGILMLVLTRAGKVGMPDNKVSSTITGVATMVDSWVSQIPFINLIFLVLVGGFIYLLLKRK